MFRLCVVAVLLLAASCAIGQETAKIGPEPHPTPSPAPTTEKPITTPKPTTPTIKPTTPTNKPTAPTTKPTTSSTTTTTTTTTTVAPPTTKPTPTPKPTPVPVPTPGMWSANFTNTNRTCLVVRAAIQIEIPVNVNKTMKINLPENATSVGDCLNSTEILKLTWEGGNTILLNFSRTNASKFELERFEADLNVTLPGQNATILRYQHVKPEFATPLDNSYRCNKEQTFNITASDNPKNVAYLYLSDLQFQAFRNVTGHKFDSAIDCESGTQRDVIPIVVGCVLAALVVLVLAGYLFGRRRCQARGYLSM